MLVHVLVAAGKPPRRSPLGRDLAARLEASSRAAATGRPARHHGPGRARRRRRRRRGRGRRRRPQAAAERRRRRRAHRPHRRRRRAASPSTRADSTTADGAGRRPRWRRPPPPASPRSSARRCSCCGRGRPHGRRHGAPRPWFERAAAGRGRAHGLAALAPAGPAGAGARSCGRAATSSRCARPATSPRGTARSSRRGDGPQPRRRRAVRLRPRRVPRRGAGVRRRQPPLRAGHRVRSPTCGSPVRTPSPATTRPCDAAIERRARAAIPTTRGSSATSTAGCSLTRAFVADELERAARPARHDDRARRRAPADDLGVPRPHPWALLHTIDDDDLGAAARAEFAEAADRIGLVVYRAFGDVIEAVALGRAGDAARPTARFDADLRPRSGRDGLSAGAIALRCAARRPSGHPRRLGRPGRAGCGSARRSSPTAATTGSPAAAAPCWARPGRRCRAGGGATRRCRRRCGPRRHQPGGRRAQAGRRRAAPTRRSPPSCSCPRRPSSGT